MDGATAGVVEAGTGGIPPHSGNSLPGSGNRSKPIFQAREGFSTDFRDIAARAVQHEPTLGLDEALGVRWLKPRGLLIGLRYGTLRQRRMMEINLRAVGEKRAAAEKKVRKQVVEEFGRAELTGDESPELLEEAKQGLEAVIAARVGAAMEDAEYAHGLQMFAPLLVLPDPASADGLRQMTLDEIQERVDLVDFEPLSRLAYPAVSPLQAVLDAGANPNL